MRGGWRCNDCGKDDCTPVEHWQRIAMSALAVLGVLASSPAPAGLDRKFVRKLLGDHHRLMQTTARNCFICWQNRDHLAKQEEDRDAR